MRLDELDDERLDELLDDDEPLPPPLALTPLLLDVRELPPRPSRTWLPARSTAPRERL